MSKLLAVFGATGNQGGSVIRAILNDPTLSKEFKIRGITRDVSKPASKELEAKGVEMVAADMASVEKAAPAVKDAHTVFLVTNFWESANDEVEIAQGKAVTDASKAAGVKHLIFSSLIDTTEASKGHLPNITHFVGKSKIEKYIRDSGIPASFVLPGLFMSNMFTQIRKGDDGVFTLALPVSPEKAQIPLFDVASDMGKFVNGAIRQYPNAAGKHIYAASDYYTPSRVAAEFSEVIGKPAQAIELPSETFKSFLPPQIAQEMLENMLLLQDPGYYGGGDLAESLALLTEKPTSWKEFVEKNKAKWE
ncbi:Fc.00g033570.m01.CDS01 [Cosmosporella sp. VM-42]